MFRIAYYSVVCLMNAACLYERWALRAYTFTLDTRAKTFTVPEHWEATR